MIRLSEYQISWISLLPLDSSPHTRAVGFLVVRGSKQEEPAFTLPPAPVGALSSQLVAMTSRCFQGIPGASASRCSIPNLGVHFSTSHPTPTPPANVIDCILRMSPLLTPSSVSPWPGPPPPLPWIFAVVFVCSVCF